MLAVWADQVEQVIPNAQRIEEALIAYLWQDEKEIIGEDGKSEYDPSDSSFFNLPTQISSARQLNITSEGNPQIQRPGETGSSQAVGDTSNVEIEDPELAAVKAARKERPVAFISAFLTGCSGGLTMVLMGFGLREYSARYILTISRLFGCSLHIRPRRLSLRFGRSLATYSPHHSISLHSLGVLTSKRLKKFLLTVSFICSARSPNLGEIPFITVHYHHLAILKCRCCL